MTTNTQFKTAGNLNYNGAISVPMNKSVESVFNMDVFSAFKIGSTVKLLSLTGGSMTISAPMTGKNIGDIIAIYNSRDNGASWYAQNATTVVESGSVPSISFSINQLMDFSILDGTSIGTVSYSTTERTIDPVIATLNLNTGTVIGSNTHTFLRNDTFTFRYLDPDGNTGAVDAVVNWLFPNCMNPAAYNYNPEATQDDGVCVFDGCMDPIATNYNS